MAFGTKSFALTAAPGTGPGQILAVSVVDQKLVIAGCGGAISTGNSRGPNWVICLDSEGALEWTRQEWQDSVPATWAEFAADSVLRFYGCSDPDPAAWGNEQLQVNGLDLSTGLRTQTQTFRLNPAMVMRSFQPASISAAGEGWFCGIPATDAPFTWTTSGGELKSNPFLDAPLRPPSGFPDQTKLGHRYVRGEMLLADSSRIFIAEAKAIEFPGQDDGAHWVKRVGLVIRVNDKYEVQSAVTFGNSSEDFRPKTLVRPRFGSGFFVACEVGRARSNASDPGMDIQLRRFSNECVEDTNGWPQRFKLVDRNPANTFSPSYNLSSMAISPRDVFVAGVANERPWVASFEHSGVASPLFGMNFFEGDDLWRGAAIASDGSGFYLIGAMNRKASTSGNTDYILVRKFDRFGNAL